MMKSLWVRHPHKSPHNHTLHVPAKMNDSVLIIYKLISSLSKTSFHHLIFNFPKTTGKTHKGIKAEIFNQPRHIRMCKLTGLRWHVFASPRSGSRSRAAGGTPGNPHLCQFPWEKKTGTYKGNCQLGTCQGHQRLLCQGCRNLVRLQQKVGEGLKFPPKISKI